MTRPEFDIKLNDEFSLLELALLNFNIYYNPDHIEYYMRFGAGDYAFCFDYLIRNRHLLSIKHTPKKWKEQARRALKDAEAMAAEPVFLIRGADDEIYMIDDIETVRTFEKLFNELPEDEALKIALPLLNPQKYGKHE